MDTDAFLHAQSIEYQRHLSQLTEIRTTLEHQLTIQSFKTIPKQYQPQNHLKTSNPTLTEEFMSDYSHLFFRHLEKVTNNQIKVELHKAALTNIVIQTEVHLSKSSLTPEKTSVLYTKFCQDNDITERVPIPELQAKFQPIERVTAKERRRKRGQKRKCTTPSPCSMKQTRQDHFLSPGLQQTQTPP